MAVQYLDFWRESLRGGAELEPVLHGQLWEKGLSAEPEETPTFFPVQLYNPRYTHPG